jgi:hypothetical protein
MGRPVELYVYDLTQGMARSISPMLLGQQIEGVWHTGLVLDGVEYFYGQGINKARAGTTMFGAPLKKLLIGCAVSSTPRMGSQRLLRRAPSPRRLLTGIPPLLAPASGCCCGCCCC